MIGQLPCNTTTIPRSLSHVIQSCISCKEYSSQYLSFLLPRRGFSKATVGSNGYDHISWPKTRISTVARQIRETGKLPKLPSEPTVKLIPITTQRRRRSENIVRHDLKATVRAHHVANTLAHGSIHLDLNEDMSMKIPQRLAVTPSRFLDDEDDKKSTEMAGGGIGIDSSYRFAYPAKIEPTQHMNPKDEQEKINKGQGEAQHSELFHRFMKLDKNCDALTRLDAEIHAFEEWTAVTVDEANAARRSFDSLQGVLNEKFPDIKLELHGSRATGLARPMSDIDIRLVISRLEKRTDERGPSPGRPVNKQEYVKVLRKIKIHLHNDFGSRYQVEQVKPGRVPLLDICDRRCGLTIQMAGIAIPTAHATEFTKYFQAEYPQIKTLFVLLRLWTERIGYEDASTGGISSYLLFNMILTSITHSKVLFDHQDVGKQLTNFLKFWSIAKVDTTGYAPDPARTFPKFASNIVEDNVASKAEEGEEKTAFSPSRLTAENILKFETVGSVTGEMMHEMKTCILSNLPSKQQVANAKHIGPSDSYLEGIKFLTTYTRSQLRNRNGNVPALLLQDPANPKNNLGSSARRFTGFQREMENALRHMTKSFRLWNERVSLGLDFRFDKTDTEEVYLLQTLLQAGGNCSIEQELRKLERRRRRLRLAFSESNS